MQEWRIEEQRRPGSRGRNKGCGGRCSKSRGSSRGCGRRALSPVEAVSRGCRNIEGTGIKGTGVYRSIKDEAWPLLKDVTDSEPEPKAKQREYAYEVIPLLTVRRALKIGGLAKSGLVAGHQGLDNEIHSVDVIEVPDIRDWIKPNELAVTSGFCGERQQARSLVRDMAENKAAALAVKTGRYLGDTIPEVMIAAAKEAGFPLIEVPADIPYTEITLPIISAILNEHAYRFQYESYIRGMLQKCVIENRGIGALANTIAEIVGSPTCIVSHDGRLLASCRKHLEHRNIKALLDQSRKQSGSVTDGSLPGTWFEDLLCVPACGKGGILGYLIVDRSKQGPLDVFEETALREAVTVVVLELTKHRIVQEAETTLKRRLLEYSLAHLQTDLLLPDIQELPGFVFKEPYAAILVKPRQHARLAADRGRWLTARKCLELVKCSERPSVGSWLPVFVDRERDEVIMVWSGIGTPDSNMISDQCVAELQRLQRCLCRNAGIEMLLGVSRIHVGIDSYASAVDEARKAARIGNSCIFTEGVMLAQDTAIYEFIDNIDRDTQARFAEDNLKQLIGQDGNPELIKTLAVFLYCGGQISEAAERLFIHRNTLNYRLDKISALLGCDVRQPRNRSRLEIALVAACLSGVIPRQGD